MRLFLVYKRNIILVFLTSANHIVLVIPCLLICAILHITSTLLLPLSWLMIRLLGVSLSVVFQLLLSYKLMMHQYFYSHWVDLKQLTQALSVARFILYHGVYGRLPFKDLQERKEMVGGGC